ncbi:MAG: ChaN family lipoprotein [Leptolyngbyaceae cyanobacterium]
MSIRFQLWGWGWALAGTLLITAPACSGDEAIAPQSTPMVLSSTEDDAFQALQSADVVYLGERHDSPLDHAAQLEIIKALYAADPEIAIALEMFQRPFQPVIDRYLAGDISEAALVKQTEYQERWGFPWEFYAPVVRFAQAQDLPVLALNAPAEITRQIAREGLTSLSGNDFRYIPPVEAIDTTNPDYRDFVTAAFGAHGAHGDFNFDNFFAAQVTWDETMAMTIAEFKADNPDTQVVVLAGNGHVIYGWGIPDRVQRRLGEELIQQIVVLNPSPEVEQAKGAIADLFWYSEGP